MTTPRPCVLLVDDEPVARRALVRALQRIAQVVDVESAEAALSVLDTGTVIDVIVADVAARGLSGCELLRALRTRHPLMISRLIAVTGADERCIDDAFRDAIGDRLLAEPVEAEELHLLVLAVAGSADVAAE